MATTAVKVKAFADRYGLTSKEVLKELAAIGHEEIRTASNNIPAAILPKIEEHFDEMMRKKDPQASLIEEAESQFEEKTRATQNKIKKRPMAEDSGERKGKRDKREKWEKGQDKGDRSQDKGDRNQDRIDKGQEKSEKVPDKSDRNQDRNVKNDRNEKNQVKNDKNQIKNQAFQPQQKEPVQPVDRGEIHIKTPIVVNALSKAMETPPNEVISALIKMNVLANINQTIEQETAQKVAEKFGFTLIVDKRDKEEHARQNRQADQETAPEEAEYNDDPRDLKPRPPIVTFMGHVDHGKTSLQDAIRKTHVAAGEAGGITQHIGASCVTINGQTITFVDTPGHEAFTQMRARGANVTDIVVLVVAADDGFMPQTIEAMNHANAAKVPIVVAMNKCDLPDADTQKVLLHMQQHGLTSEDWGGSVAAIPVSAKTGTGLDDLLERILLEAEMLELKANPKRPAQAYVLESQLEQGLGPTASVVVKNGTLRVGDPVICGEYFGKVKTLIDFRGHRVAMAPPSMPVKVVGLSGVPEAGTKMAVCRNINEAKTLAEARCSENRIENLSNKTSGASLEDLFSKMDDSKKNSLKVIVKTDVRGSSEAIVESLKKLPSEKISVEVLHSGVGAITENDVLLAASSEAIVVGFHVRVNPGVNDLAKKENVEIRLYSIIYELLEDITDALAGKLEPEKREKELGQVRILKIFTLSDGTKICGCKVEKGIAKVGSKARVRRGQELLFNGEVRSLKHVKESVKEVHQGMECGIRLDNFVDFKEGDTIQLYDIELKKASLI